MCGILGIVSKTNDTPIKIYEGLTYLQHEDKIVQEYVMKMNV